MLLTPGTTFAGDYLIERPLAEGGMGAVYVATQISTGQPRALKVMQPQLVADEKSRARFLEEARIGSRIASEHVVSVVAAGVDASSGIPWLAMELLEGVDLDRYVRERGALPPAEALELLEQAAHALADAHAKGIIHRDLKPENLFVARARRRNAESTVKILDFGIARTIAESRVAATVTSAIGSPLWMAPEQAQAGAKLRPATDVWALGLITFYMLTGKQYWLVANHPEFNLSALLVEVMTLAIEPPSQRGAQLGVTVSLPYAFDGWFLRCLARDPEQRFADAGVAIRELRQVLSGAYLPTSPQASPAPGTQPLPHAYGTAPVITPSTHSVSQSVSPSPSQPLEPTKGGVSGFVMAAVVIGGIGIGVAALAAGVLAFGGDDEAPEERPVAAIDPSPVVEAPEPPPAELAPPPPPEDAHHYMMVQPVTVAQGPFTSEERARYRAFVARETDAVADVAVAPLDENESASAAAIASRSLTGHVLVPAIVSFDEPSGRVTVTVTSLSYPGREERAVLQGAAVSSSRTEAVEAAFRAALRGLANALGGGPVEEVAVAAAPEPAVVEEQVVRGRVSAGAPDVRGSLSREVVSRVAARNQGDIRACHERTLRSAPALAGRVVVRFIIGPTGAVQTADVERSTVSNSALEACVAQAVRQWTFPSPDGGGVVSVSLPYTFSVEDARPARSTARTSRVGSSSSRGGYGSTGGYGGYDRPAPPANPFK
jgi:TonB family protein